MPRAAVRFPPASPGSGGRPRRAQAHSLGLGLQRRVLHHRDTSRKGVAHATGALLDDVSQFMAEELLARGRLGVVLAGCEIKVGAVREGEGADRGGLVPDMHAHIGETGVEERLHLLLDRFGQRLPAAAGLERKISREGEGIARIRLDRGRTRRLGSYRLGDLRAARHRWLNGAGSRLGGKNWPRGLARARRRLQSTGLGAPVNIGAGTAAGRAWIGAGAGGRTGTAGAVEG